MTALVRFRTHADEFTIVVEDVREVRPTSETAPLPGAHAGVAGVVRRQGEALTMLETLGKGGSAVLILESESRRFGLRVEEIVDIDALAAALRP